MSPASSPRPAPADYAPYFERYVSLVPENDVLAVLGKQIEEVGAVFRAVTAERELFRYAPGKWSVRQIAGHLIDAERVFGYRALCISRAETANLPGFDENAYVANAPFDSVPLADLREEFEAVRTSNLMMLRQLETGAWERRGIANATEISVKALAFVMAGHARHHMGVLASRYA